MKEVALALRLTKSRVGQIFNKESAGRELAKEWDSKHPDRQIRPAKGRKPALFPTEFLKEIFGQLEEKNFPARTAVVEELGVIRNRKLPENIVGVLESRTAAKDDFNHLLSTVIATARELKMWCVVGSCFSDADRAGSLFKAFEERAKRVRAGHAQPPEMLFLHPLCRATRLRSNAEEGPRNPSYSVASEDVENGEGFLKETRMGDYFVRLWTWLLRNHEQLAFAVDKIRWSRVPPPSFLLWSEDLAFVEPYGFGRLSKVDYDERTFIGGHAPLLLVKPGGTDDYHERLQNGFRWIFDPAPNTDGVVTYKVWDIQKLFDKLPKQFSPPLGRYPLPIKEEGEASAKGRKARKPVARRRT
ncbi:MAG: hypothetical protein ACHQ9S_23040 [Candidatus Binatia bacterium]